MSPSSVHAHGQCSGMLKLEDVRHACACAAHQPHRSVEKSARRVHVGLKRVLDRVAGMRQAGVGVS